MIAIPRIEIPAPIKSHLSGITLSIINIQIKAVATYIPPYAAYTLLAATGCKVRSHANTTRLMIAGNNNQIDPSFFIQR